MFRVLILVTIFSHVGALGHWCDGVAVEDNLGLGAVEVYFAQAPLFSSDASTGDFFGKIGMFHSAILFKQPKTNKSWTLEMVLAARNVKGANITSATGFFPEIHDDDTFTWHDDARYCFSNGVLNGEAHYSQGITKIAEIEPQLFKKILNEFIPTVNGTGNGIDPKYNYFRVSNLLGKDIVADTTCGNGAIWVRDYIASQNVTLLVTDLKVTRMTVPVLSISYVNPNTEDWKNMTAYYRQVYKVLVEPNATLPEKKELLMDLWPLKYVYDPLRERYMKLVGSWGTALPRYEKVPFPWVPTLPWDASVVV